ncbi:MAG: 3'(2'),5'-bisphosphate nucleotidase CysQ [Geminicoccaceae bacterium]
MGQAMGLLREAVADAGRIAMRHFRNGHASWEKGPGQIVTDADIEIDAFLKKVLLEGSPEGTGWLSEETLDDPARLDAARLWVVDPIDGTRSFAAGKPEFTVSAALVEDGRPLCGIVLNPATGEHFEAVRGEGTLLDGKPVTVAPRESVDGASIVVSLTENRKRAFDRMFASADVSSIGSLALKLACVAAGRFDGFFSWRRSHDWDIAAAVLLIEEAGGRITDSFGEPVRLNQPTPRQNGLIAAAPTLHGRLVASSLERHERETGGGKKDRET